MSADCECKIRITRGFCVDGTDFMIIAYCSTHAKAFEYKAALDVIAASKCLCESGFGCARCFSVRRLRDAE